MSAATPKSVLVIVRQPPYGGSLARSSLEFALSAATFDQPVSVLFMGDGLLQLIPEQDSAGLGVKNIAKLIKSFPLYELNNLYVDETALLQYGLTPQSLPQQLQVVDNTAIQQLFCQHDHLLSF